MAALIAALAALALAGTGCWYLIARHRRESAYTQAIAEGVAPLPPDLVPFVLAESEPWAQDDVERFVREQYAKHRNWSDVRSRLVN